MTVIKLPSNDVIETIVNGIKPQKNHLDLIKQLKTKSNLTSIHHALSYDGLSDSSGVYDAQHNLVHPKAREWISNQIKQHDGNAYNTWLDLKNKGYLSSSIEGSLEYFIMQVGSGPADFIQLQIYQWQEVISHSLFELKPWNRVTDDDDLLDNSGVGRGSRITNRVDVKQYYEFDKILVASELIAKYNARYNQQLNDQSTLEVTEYDKTFQKFVKTTYAEKFPLIAKFPSNPTRLMEDWAQSSAGMNGHVFSDHWVLHNSQWTDHSGQQNINIVPYWTSKRPIKALVYKKSMTAYTVADLATKTDIKSGYPFSWYFYMLHGNRIGDWFAVLMLKAAESGLIYLPEQDYLVLKRWGEYKYGF